MIDLEIEGLVLLSVAPIAIAFILLAVIGAFSAATHAYSHLTEPPNDFETLDTAPTLVDFALYSRTPKPWHRIGLLTYHVLLTLALAEAAYLWFESFRYNILAGSLVRYFSLFMLVWGLIRLIGLWASKVKHMVTGHGPV